MNKINPLLTESNNGLANSKQDIFAAIKTARDYAFPKLHIDWDIDIIFTDKIEMTLPENKVGGHTFQSDFIQIIVDRNGVDQNLIAETLVHELCHAGRWGKNNEWMNTLFDCLIFEGLAVTFEAEFAKKTPSKQLFLQTILERKEQDNQCLLAKLHDQLNSKAYNYDTIFLTGDKNLPRWTGYSVGYYLVQKYLNNTSKTIKEVFANNYADFRVVLEK